MTIRIKRIYEPASPGDGTRVLVDRLWPRGVSRAAGGIDHWLKEIAPSASLRKWFGHDPSRWKEFKKRYFSELDENPQVLGKIQEVAEQGPLTLLYSARDTDYNQAVALLEYLSERHRKGLPPATRKLSER